MDDEARDTIERFHEALNHRDLDALGDLITDDCVFEATSPAPDGTRHVGRQAVLEACRVFFAGSPRTHFEMEEMFGADVGQVDVAGDDVVQLRARLAEEKCDVVHDLAGLAGRVSDRHRLAGLQVLGHLPAEVHGVAGHDRLAEVVGDALLRVGVGGVEGADPAMPAHDDRPGHANASQRKRNRSSSPADLAIRSTAGPKS